MGTASGAVLVSECTDHSGPPTSAARARGGWWPPCRTRTRGIGRRRTSGGWANARFSGCTTPAPSRRWRWMAKSRRRRRPARGVRRPGRVPARVARPARRRGRRGPAGEEEEAQADPTPGARLARRRWRRQAPQRGHLRDPRPGDRHLLDHLPGRRAAPVARPERRRQVGFRNRRNRAHAAGVPRDRRARALLVSVPPGARRVRGNRRRRAYAFDAGKTFTSSSTAAGNGGAPPETSGALCRWAAHEAGATRAVAAAAGGCVTGSSTGPIMAWKFRRGDGTRAPETPAPALVSKLLGHVAAVVGLSTGNPAHLVSGAHDGTVRVWDMPRLSDAPGARGAEPGTDLAGSSMTFRWARAPSRRRARADRDPATTRTTRTTRRARAPDPVGLRPRRRRQRPRRRPRPSGGRRSTR